MGSEACHKELAFLVKDAILITSETSVEMRYENENIWLTQKMMAALYNVSVAAINQHLKRVFADNELDESAVIKDYTIQGWTMDVERLKRGGNFTDEFFGSFTQLLAFALERILLLQYPGL